MKTFILDTNVCLHDPEALETFEENHVVIPLPVVKELEKHKKGNLDINYAARKTLNHLDTPPKNIEVILYKKLEEIEGVNYSDVDTLILRYCLTYIHQHPKKEIILITKDTAMRIIARTLGIKCEDYEKDKSYETYNGYRKGNINQNLLRNLLQGGVKYEEAFIEGLFPNEYILYPKDVIGKFEKDEIKLVQSKIISGIYPRNPEQIMAMDALIDPKISIVTLTGKSGSGKTLLSLTTGLSQKYEKIIVSKPTIPISKDLDTGFLPGSLKDKLEPWFLPFKDNIDYILSLKMNKYTTGEIEERVSYFSSAHIRGRSIPNQYIIIDEAQNLTAHETKTIITRIGEGSKIVLIGDLDQIDRPYLDRNSCGLNHVINNFKGQKIFAHVHLKRGERSELATLASKLL